MELAARPRAFRRAEGGVVVSIPDRPRSLTPRLSASLFPPPAPSLSPAVLAALQLGLADTGQAWGHRLRPRPRPCSHLRLRATSVPAASLTPRRASISFQAPTLCLSRL